MCVHTPVFFCLCTCVMSVCHAVSPEPPPALRPPAPMLRSALSPSDTLALCQERMIVFESCQDIKRGRSPSRGRVNNKLVTSSKVRGNMTSQSGSLIGCGLTSCEGMDSSCFNASLMDPFSSRGKHVLCPSSIQFQRNEWAIINYKNE